MFSRIDPLFKTLFRHAETTDARQDIKRKDPLHERAKGKDGDNDPDNTPLWEDETDVSIEALSSFLHSLLGDKNPIFNQNAEPMMPSSSVPENAKNAYAVQAYQKRSKEQSSTMHITEKNYTLTPQETQDVSLAEKDRALVEALLDDLKILKKHDVDFLRISRRGTFFESVQDAIKEAHSKFNL